MLNKTLNVFFKFACYLTVLAGIIFAALLFFNTGLIEDEIYSIICANPATPFKTLFNMCYIADAHPPLYNIMLYFFNHIAYIHAEFWPRLPSMFFWFATLACSWLIFPKRLGKSARLIYITLMLSSALLAIYLTSARGYAWLLFLANLMWFFTLHILHQMRAGQQPAKGSLVQFFVLGLALCLVHYYGAVLYVISAFFITGYGLYKRRQAWPFAVVLFGVLFIFSFWLIPNYITLKGAAVFDGNWWGNNQPVWFAFTEFWALAFGPPLAQLLIAVLICWGILYTLKTKMADYIDLILPFALYLFVFMALTAISLKINIMQPRYFIVLLPAVYFMVADNAAPLLKRYNLAILLWFVLFALAFKANINFLAQYNNNPREAKPFAVKYLQDYKGSPVFVASYYPYNAQVTPQIYAYYINNYYGYPLNIVNFTGATPPQNAIVYLPGCSFNKTHFLTSHRLAIIYEDTQANYCLFKTL